MNSEAQSHECLIQDGREANGEDSSCESYWECEDGEGTLQRCEGDSQFDFARRVCLHNREVWCQWQYDTVQQRGGLAGTPFDPRGQGSLTYTGARAVTSFTHTHDGSTHVHLLDANGRYVDTTDHFHQYTRPQGQRRQQKREAGDDFLGLKLRARAADVRQKRLQGSKQLAVTHKSSSHDRSYNSRSRQLGIDYDVMALKSSHTESDEERKHGDHVEKGENGMTGEYDDNTDYDDASSQGFVCGDAHGREPNAGDSECKTFWECSEYKGTQMECDEGYRYDIHSKDCRSHQEVDCKGQWEKLKNERSEHRSEVKVKDDGVTVIHHFYHGGKPNSADLKPRPEQNDNNFAFFEQEAERSVMKQGLNNQMSSSEQSADIYISNDDLNTVPQRTRMSRSSAGVPEESSSLPSYNSLNPFSALISHQRNLPNITRKLSTSERTQDKSGNKADYGDEANYSMDANHTITDNIHNLTISLLQNPTITEEIQPHMQKFRAKMPFLLPAKPEALEEVEARGVKYEISIKPLEGNSLPRVTSNTELRPWSYQAPNLEQ